MMKRRWILFAFLLVNCKTQTSNPEADTPAAQKPHKPTTGPLSRTSPPIPGDSVSPQPLPSDLDPSHGQPQGQPPIPNPQPTISEPVTYLPSQKIQKDTVVRKSILLEFSLPNPTHTHTYKNLQLHPHHLPLIVVQLPKEIAPQHTEILSLAFETDLHGLYEETLTVGYEVQGERKTFTLDLNVRVTYEPLIFSLRDLRKVPHTVSGSGSGAKDIYEDAGHHLYVLKEGQPGAGEPGWIEAYAGTLYRYFLKEHAPEEAFIIDGNKVYGASQLNPTFKELYDYHGVNRNPLPVRDPSLEAIGIVSFLLCEIDLKGLSSNDSNLGVIQGTTTTGLTYFKIDHGQSFYCGYDSIWAHNRFHFPYLLAQKSRAEFFTSTNLDHLVEDASILSVLHDIQQTPRADLVRVLDACETQLRHFSVYPDDSYSYYYHLRNQGTNPVTNDFILTRDHTIYKEMVLDRFDQLVRLR